MDYDQMLKLVKVQNPTMAHKEQQKLASKKFKEFKDAQEAHKSNDPSILKEGEQQPPAVMQGLVVPKEDKQDIRPVSRRLPINELMGLEKQIRALGADRNRIMSMGRELIKEGELVKHGKDGVNTLVTFEDKYGNKIPLYGYFKLFI